MMVARLGLKVDDLVKDNEGVRYRLVHMCCTRMAQSVQRLHHMARCAQLYNRELRESGHIRLLRQRTSHQRIDGGVQYSVR